MKRTVLVNELIENVSSIKANIIEYTGDVIDISDFLVDFAKNLKSAFPEYNIVHLAKQNNPNKDLLPLLSEFKTLTNQKPILLIIDDLFYYSSPEGIINFFYNDDNFHAFIFANINVSAKLKEKDTIIRGRYNIFHLVPSLMLDEKENNTSSFFAFKNDYFKRDDKAKNIYKYLIDHSGEVLTYRAIYKSLNKKIGLLSIIKIIDDLVNHNYFYMLKRIDISKQDELSNGFIYYPLIVEDIDASSLNDEMKFKRKKESYLLAKMVNDGFTVNKAISYVYTFVNNKRIRKELDRGYLFNKNDKNIIIKINYIDLDEDMDLIYKSTNNIPHIIAILGNIAYINDKNGLTYVGLEKLLKEGLINYGRI